MSAKTIKVNCKAHDLVDFHTIKPLQGNYKKRSEAQIQKLKNIVIKRGIRAPSFVYRENKDNIWAMDTHGRLIVYDLLEKEGWTIPLIPTDYIECKNLKEAKQVLLEIDSRFGKADQQGFEDFISDLDTDFLSDIEIPDIDIDFGEKEINVSLSDRFIIPPFSVLRASSGIWQGRKKAWLGLGIQSEKGRNDGMLKHMAVLCKKAQGSTLPTESIFDPVLCEIMYRWFCPQNGQILDPFAGGSVRGIVAGYLDYNYTGIDLRHEQIEANKEQLHLVTRKPMWICGDSRKIGDFLDPRLSFDFVFSCPPYADLEVYSKQPEDLSNMDYPDFKTAYFDIINKSCKYLKDNSFAIFVVGEARAKTGEYYGIVPDTIEAFEKAGLKFYNEMILVTQIAAKALTVAEGFVKSRKVGKIHQNILVFVKGDPKMAAEKCKLDIKEIDEALKEYERISA